MKRHLTEDEINQAKGSKAIRDDMMTRIDKVLEIGKTRLVTVDGQDPETGYKMGVYRMTRRVATEDAIRQFCDAVDDLNPLYRSRDYAKNNCFGRIIAPAQFLGAIAPYSGIAKATEELDFHTSRLDAGVSMEWFKPIYEGDSFTVHEYPTAIKDLTRENTALQFLVEGDRIYKKQTGEIVAIAHISGIAVVVAPPSGNNKQIGRKVVMHRFSEKEIEDWYALMEAEEIRGGVSRFWEDVREGDSLPSTHHVFSMTEHIAYNAAMGKSYSWRQQMAARKDSWHQAVDPDSGLPDFTNLHLTDAASQRLGMPYANALGAQMRAWLGRMLGHWMGDDGFIKKMSDQVRGILYRESFVLCKGKVTKKYIENSEHLVDISMTLEDHNGGLIIPKGSATVRLPSRKMGSSSIL
ncbi:MAG: MaoC family dehydratase N-terminal domain-containing protein [Proteobacteria bacterium]|nr:MaoC family dehydratase N-terminal domain-containing protein [Pseudomonadota bacterium]MBU4471253.1 MaoC family dehydratase N-terminal domain-containing protein [Pseudomonadota bacterium]MCG2752854.1 MaoC family dehydratase N-terminal domain-containing protein [Desulfobacteraceae bacterium]